MASCGGCYVNCMKRVLSLQKISRLVLFSHGEDRLVVSLLGLRRSRMSEPINPSKDSLLSRAFASSTKVFVRIYADDFFHTKGPITYACWRFPFLHWKILQIDSKVHASWMDIGFLSSEMVTILICHHHYARVHCFELLVKKIWDKSGHFHMQM